MSDQSVKVREVGRQDHAGWLRLRSMLWPEGMPDEHAQEIDAFFAGTAREPLAVLVAEATQGELVGLAELSIRTYAEGCDSDRIGYLEGWFVAPEYRRQGIARLLIGAAEAWAARQGCTEFASDTRVDNEVSVAAHLSCGFEEVEVIRCFRKRLRAAPESGGDSVAS